MAYFMPKLGTRQPNTSCMQVDTIRYNRRMMKRIVTLLTLSLTLPALGQTFDISRDVITDPNLSLRCKEQMKERAEKIKFRQKLNDLMKRNDVLLKKMPQTRPSMIKRLEANQISVKNELYLADLQVKAMEETIIRSGCPGINL